MTLHEIREAYDRNYRELIKIIIEMGGEKNIIFHQQKNSPLFRKLRQLQRVEHRLSKMEEALAENA